MFWLAAMQQAMQRIWLILLKRPIWAAPEMRWADIRLNVFWLVVEGKSLLAQRRRPFVGAEQRANDAHVRIYISQRCHFPDASPPYCISSSNKKSCWHGVRPRGVIHHCGRKEAQDYSRGLVRLCSLLRRLFFITPSVTRQALKLVLTHPAEPKSKRSVAWQKAETCASSWPLFQLSGITLTLGRWKIRDPANVAIVHLYIFCSESKLFIIILICHTNLFCVDKYLFIWLRSQCWKKSLLERGMIEVKKRNLYTWKKKTWTTKSLAIGAGLTNITEPLTNWGWITKIF